MFNPLFPNADREIDRSMTLLVVIAAGSSLDTFEIVRCRLWFTANSWEFSDQKNRRRVALNEWWYILHSHVLVSDSGEIHFKFKTHNTSHSAYDATSTESNGVKIDGSKFYVDSKGKFPRPSPLSTKKSPFTPQRKIFLILWGEWRWRNFSLTFSEST